MSVVFECVRVVATSEIGAAMPWSGVRVGATVPGGSWSGGGAAVTWAWRGLSLLCEWVVCCGAAAGLGLAVGLSL